MRLSSRSRLPPRGFSSEVLRCIELMVLAASLACRFALAGRLASAKRQARLAAKLKSPHGAGRGCRHDRLTTVAEAGSPLALWGAGPSRRPGDGRQSLPLGAA